MLDYAFPDTAWLGVLYKQKPLPHLSLKKQKHSTHLCHLVGGPGPCFIELVPLLKHSTNSPLCLHCGFGNKFIMAASLLELLPPEKSPFEASPFVPVFSTVPYGRKPGSRHLT